jgi:hypothetical protein
MTVRLSKAKICRSAWWRGVFCVALLLVGAYVLFDLLDVDGSQIVWRPANAILVVETQQDTADRFARPDGSTPGAGGLIGPLLFRFLSAERVGRVPTTSLLRLPLRWSLPRVDLHPEGSLSPACSADPL